MEGRSTARRAAAAERTLLLLLALILWMIALVAATSLRGVVPHPATRGTGPRTTPILSAQRAAPLTPTHLASP